MVKMKTDKTELVPIDVDFRDFLQEHYKGQELTWYLGEIDDYIEKLQVKARQEGYKRCLEDIKEFDNTVVRISSSEKLELHCLLEKLKPK